MTIRFFCACGQKLKAPDKKIGTTYDCPICGAPVVVPEQSDPLAQRVKAGLADNPAKRKSRAHPREDPPAGDDELVGVAAEARPRAQRDAAQEEPPGTEERDPTAPAAASAANIARDLITRRITKSRDYIPSPAPEPKAAEKEGSDYVALARELGTTLLPGITAIALLCTAVYWLSSSVMSTRSLPDLGNVSGVVTLDGSPLPGAIVTFQPAAAEEPGSKSSSSMGRTDEEGRFTLIYVKDVKGAVVGEHKVFVQAPLATGKETIPAQYNSNTKLTANVKPGSNEFEFKLQSSR